MLEEFKNHIGFNLPFLKQARFIVAISGGIDSVVLTHLCKQLELDFALAHCNFNLRGEASNADEDFVLDLADALDLEVFVEGFDCALYAKINKLSIQVAARELRYSWFDELCRQLDFDFVATAHHADDDLETFLINLSRGTGLEGLTGIPQQNNFVIRPLLPFSREQIEQYATANKLSWREDSSNASTKYLRNQLRHEVIPKLKEATPHFLDNFLKTQAHLTEAKTIVADRVDEVMETVVIEISSDGVYFDVNAIKQLSNPKAYLYEMLKDYGFSEWNDIVNLLDAQSGKQILSQTHRLIKHRDTIILADKKPSEPNRENQIQITENQTETPIGVLCLETVETHGKSDVNTIFVDKDLLKFPLILRKWQEGDYFYPIGMDGKKKLSKFFKDEKLSILDKENAWLLCSGNRILWVVGMRQDNRFKVNYNTNHILKISLQ